MLRFLRLYPDGATRPQLHQTHRQAELPRRHLHGRIGPLTLAVGLLYSGVMQADEQERFRHYLSLPLEELMQQTVTISSRSAQSLSRAPSVISVITAEDIGATGATNLADVLQAVPGIHVKYSQFGFRPLVGFRGANDKQTLLMVDAAPMSDLMWRQGSFGRVCR